MRFKSRSFFILLIIVALGFGILEALSWPLRASILVLTIGSFCWLLAVIQLFVELRPQHEAMSSGMDIELTEDQELAKAPLRALDIWAWLIGCIIGIRLLGLYITIPLWTFSYAFRHGSRWWVALMLAVLCWGFLWGFFDLLLNMPFPEAILPLEEWLRG